MAGSRIGQCWSDCFFRCFYPFHCRILISNGDKIIAVIMTFKPSDSSLRIWITDLKHTRYTVKHHLSTSVRIPPYSTLTGRHLPPPLSPLPPFLSISGSGIRVTTGPSTRRSLHSLTSHVFDDHAARCTFKFSCLPASLPACVSSSHHPHRLIPIVSTGEQL